MSSIRLAVLERQASCEIAETTSVTDLLNAIANEGNPSGRLHHLLDKQDVDEGLTPEEQREAEALVELSEFISLLNLRAKRVARQP